MHEKRERYNDFIDIREKNVYSLKFIDKCIIKELVEHTVVISELLILLRCITVDRILAMCTIDIRTLQL